MKPTIGDKIYFPTDKKPYRVRCRDDRYIICTKPMNIYHTVLYTIIDLKDQRRGPDDRVFCEGYETDEQCEERLKELQQGEIRLSGRKSIPLDVEVE